MKRLKRKQISLCCAEKIMLTGRDELGNQKRARAAFRCTALIAVITAVNASNSELSDSTRPARTIITDG